MTDQDILKEAKVRVAKDNGSEDWDELWFDAQDSINPKETENVLELVVTAALQLQREQMEHEYLTLMRIGKRETLEDYLKAVAGLKEENENHLRALEVANKQITDLKEELSLLRDEKERIEEELFVIKWFGPRKEL